ncbi:MAG TPA: putative manganese-dependent inorganic diphosphatase [Desulfuromonadales bacterium]|nr:putative manganese-dependent inorganic diphosphatase [Desulfuromonadales bacterium]
MNKKRIYVIGHKNPDTDSICSAVGYAALRRQQGAEFYLPARAGNLNRQTEFVLEQLGVAAPQLLTDVYPRVRDVLNPDLATVPEDAPLAEALELFHRHGVRILPVSDQHRQPQGVLVLKRLSEHFLVSGRDEELRRVVASPESICRCLKGQFLTSADAASLEELQLYVGAMSSSTFQKKMADIEPRRTILVTGDRLRILEKGIRSGVRVLIVTGNLPVSDDLIEQARKHKVCLISTSFDTATTAWLTRLSVPVSELVSPDFPTIGLDEKLDELRMKLVHGNEPGVIVLDREKKICGVATKSNLLQPVPVNLVLVDHNELSQAVPGAEKLEILEVVDHHRLGNPHTDHPIRFIVQPLGSTCTLIASLYQEAGLQPDRKIAGLLLAGLLSDTVILKSPTTTDTDRDMVPWLGELAGLDPVDFGGRMFAAGSALDAYGSPRDVILSDFKEYEAGDVSFGIGQVEVVGFQEFFSWKQDLQDALDGLKRECALDAVGLLVTDIAREDSLLLVSGNRELPHLLGYPQKEKNLFELKGVLSRKKQLVPHLLKVFRQ